MATAGTSSTSGMVSSHCSGTKLGRADRQGASGLSPVLCPIPAVAPQTSQAGVAVMAVAVSVALLLLVVATFYCMRRKGRPGCCRRREKGAP